MFFFCFICSLDFPHLFIQIVFNSILYSRFLFSRLTSCPSAVGFRTFLYSIFINLSLSVISLVICSILIDSSSESESSTMSPL
eukprot:UN09822